MDQTTPPNDAASDEAPQLVPFTDRSGVQIAMGDQLLFLPNASTPMIMNLVEVTPLLDPNAPPGAQRLRLVMSMFVALMPGGQIPAYRVGGARAETLPEAKSNLIVMPGGKH